MQRLILESLEDRCLLSGIILPGADNTLAPAQADAATKATISENYGQLPLTFEANQGQADPQVRFLSRGDGYVLFLTPTEAVLSLRTSAATQSRSGTTQGIVDPENWTTS